MSTNPKGPAGGVEEIVPGHGAAADRLVEARGSIRAAFESLDLGFGYDEALEYLRGAPSWQAITSKRSEGLTFGALLGFAITAVEADRARQSEAGTERSDA